MKTDNFLDSNRMTPLLKFFLATTISVSFLAAAIASDEAGVFRDAAGDGLRIEDKITCTFSRVTPDGKVVLFFPTSKGNLSAIPKNGSTGGKTIQYARVGTTDRGFYRAYRSGSVTVFTHRDKPIVVMSFNEEQFDGNCDKVVPQYMSE